MGVAVLIMVLLILVLGAYFLGLGGDFFKDLQKNVQTQVDRSKDPIPDPSDDANKYTDVDTNVCDLRISFVGSVTATDIYLPTGGLGDDLYLWFGEHNWFFSAKGYPHDKAIVHYQWFCSAKASTLEVLSWHNQLLADDIQKMSLFTKSSGEDIRIKFIGESKTTGHKLTEYRDSDGDGKLDTERNQFQNERYSLPYDKDFPIEFTTNVLLKNVTEDDYKLFFWSDDYKVGVNGDDKPIGSRFGYDLNKPNY